MIIFHEGLPRHGKTYEAVVKQILPTLIKRRKVFTNIDGINFEKFSELTEIPELVLRNDLLFIVTKENVKTISSHVDDDSLVVIDELQDHFPASKTQLSPAMTEFVTQHGHRGIDIVCMGQDHRDCHMLWKRRIDTLITFEKRDVVGRPSEYTWTTHRLKRGRFVKLLSGKGTYDSKYFGLYKSHVDGVRQIDNHKDERINVLKSKGFTVYLPLFILGLLYAIYKTYQFFSPDNAQKIVNLPADKARIQSQPDAQAVTTPATKDQQPHELPPIQPPNHSITPNDDQYIDDLLGKYRPRLLALLETTDKTRLMAIIEFLDDNNIVHERLDIPQLVSLGYFVERRPYGLLLRRGNVRVPVTAFPVQHTENVTTSGNGGGLPNIAKR